MDCNCGICLNKIYQEQKWEDVKFQLTASTLKMKLNREICFKKTSNSQNEEII